jgi:nucleoid-associated protein YgaU
MLIQIDDEVREATPEEAERIELIQADAEAAQAAVQARETARQSARTKLAALGLTDAEIVALIGA